MKKPIIGITMGDPAGNGSEISVKALSRSEIYEQCRPVIIGDAACMEEAVKIAGKEGQIKIHAINDIKAAKFEYGTIDVYDMNLVNMDRHISIKDVWRGCFSVCRKGNRACAERRD